MDTYVDERDHKLLEADKYTFFVHRRIMGGDCKLLLSNHERLILCFTGHPFPVWIWTPGDVSDGENLVYQVTVKAKEAGYVPMLYTDADYVASNACYEKIGYVFRGKLCTIG